MGRLVNEKDLYSKNIKKYKQSVTSSYSRFIDSRPTFVTYFRKIEMRSTVDIGLENVEEVIGKESPIKYEKIEEVPVFGIENINLGLDIGDFGLDTNYEGEGILLPDSIKPLPDDYIIIHYLSETRLFKITNVLNDKIEGKQYYKIEFSLTSTTVDKILDQVGRDLILLYENIGTVDRAVVEKTEYQLLDYMEKIYWEIADLYINNFIRIIVLIRYS